PAIRRAVRLRLRAPHLRRLVDSLDICQSVLLNFFVRAAAGQFELDRPEQLLKLLATMARNKLSTLAHHERAERRDHRRTVGNAAEHQLRASGASPSQQLAAKELLQETRRRLAPDERQLLELREQGREWAEIATLVGGSPEALRKKLTRAIDRVAHSLGLDEVHHE